jgi:hypothetical protein
MSTSDVQMDGTVWAHTYNSRGEVFGSARRDTEGGDPGPGRMKGSGGNGTDLSPNAAFAI